jgi:4'-phosphopantetheinyl transferase
LDPVAVDVWTFEPASDEDLAGLLSDDERRRAAGLVDGGRRRDFVTGRALARAALAQQLGVDPRALPIDVEPGGRPRLVADDARAPAFSIAHCAGLVVCAVAPVAVGVDAERPRRFADPVGFSRHHFQPPEAATVAAAADPRATAARLFVLKEAYAKAVGLGLALPMTATRFEAVDSDTPRVAAVPPESGPATAWRAAVPDRGGGIVLAVVARTSGAALDVRLRPARGRLLP